MQAPTFPAAERGIDDQCCHCGEVPEFEEVNRNSEIPVKFLDFTLQIPQTGTRPLEPFVGAHDSNVIPHQAPDLVPIMIDDHQFIYVLRIPGFPFRK
jgi:hypothetical protein